MDPYEILQVDRHASSSEIRAAYLRLVKLVHPDVGGSSALFRQVEESYRILSDPVERARYDRDGTTSASTVSRLHPVPDFVGLDWRGVVAKAQSCQFEILVAEYEAAVGDPAAGRVVAQHPPVGSQAVEGTEIQIVLARPASASSVMKALGDVAAAKIGSWAAAFAEARREEQERQRRDAEQMTRDQQRLVQERWKGSERAAAEGNAAWERNRPPNSPEGVWRADPWGRHTWRLYDQGGSRWLATVADGYEVKIDDGWVAPSEWETQEPKIRALMIAALVGVYFLMVQLLSASGSGHQTLKFALAVSSVPVYFVLHLLAFGRFMGTRSGPPRHGPDRAPPPPLVR